MQPSPATVILSSFQEARQRPPKCSSQHGASRPTQCVRHIIDATIEGGHTGSHRRSRRSSRAFKMPQPLEVAYAPTRGLTRGLRRRCKPAPVKPSSNERGTLAMESPSARCTAPVGCNPAAVRPLVDRASIPPADRRRRNLIAARCASRPSTSEGDLGEVQAIRREPHRTTALRPPFGMELCRRGKSGSAAIAWPVRARHRRAGPARQPLCAG